MNENAARLALLLRAYETRPSPHWRDEDRKWATQAAALVEGSAASDSALIERRAVLGVERLRSRDRSVAPMLQAVTWRTWIAPVVLTLAFALGAALDAAGPGRHINLLAPPMLGLLAWNLFIYALIVLKGTAGLFSRRASGLGPMGRSLARAAHAVAAPSEAATVGPAPDFLWTWAHASRRLTAARVAGVFHAGAIAFATGAVASLYVRGLAFEYRAVWQSTFLDAASVHALLAAVLGPASALTGIALPTPGHLDALRYPLSGGENAAPWIHLHAVTIGLFVVGPRALLAAASRWHAARLEARFPLRLDDAYFMRILRSVRGGPTSIRGIPYSYHPSSQSVIGLNSLFSSTLGSAAVVAIDPALDYGAEDSFDAALLTQDTNLLVAMFSLAATPERETHGVFVARLVSAAASAPATQVLAVVDEAAFVSQFPADSKRWSERRAAWRALLAARGCPVVFVNLEHPDVRDAESQLERALDAHAGLAGDEFDMGGQQPAAR